MKLPMVIFPLSPQNPVMEETVWEQYTVTLHRVSPSAPKHTRPHSQNFHFSNKPRVLYPVLHGEGIQMNSLTLCRQLPVKREKSAQTTDVTDSPLSSA